MHIRLDAENAAILRDLEVILPWKPSVAKLANLIIRQHAATLYPSDGSPRGAEPTGAVVLRPPAPAAAAGNGQMFLGEQSAPGTKPAEVKLPPKIHATEPPDFEAEEQAPWQEGEEPL